MDRYNFHQLLQEESSINKKLFLKSFGKNLKNLRTAKGLTQEELGELANVNYKYIGEIERGEKNPTVIIIYKLSHALGVSVDEILQTTNYLPKSHCLPIEHKIK